MWLRLKAVAQPKLLFTVTVGSAPDGLVQLGQAGGVATCRLTTTATWSPATSGLVAMLTYSSGMPKRLSERRTFWLAGEHVDRVAIPQAVPLGEGGEVALLALAESRVARRKANPLLELDAVDFDVGVGSLRAGPLAAGGRAAHERADSGGGEKYDGGNDRCLFCHGLGLPIRE